MIIQQVGLVEWFDLDDDDEQIDNLKELLRGEYIICYEDTIERGKVIKLFQKVDK